jgi:pimeloyl-ACP methyl ester carboxylesterase
LHRLFLLTNAWSFSGDDDVFSTDLTVDELTKLYENVTRPICWIYSDQDEFFASNQDKSQLMERFKRICPAIKVTANVPHGDHSITRQDSQEYFCKVVDEFLKTI